MEKKTIGTFLGALRKASGLTQKQLAEKLNVSDKAVSRWERDECAPDLSLIPVLAEIYGVTSDEILRGQRCNPDAAARNTDAAKADKQRRQLVASTQTKFNIRSTLSIAIAIVGLVITCICNFELKEANIGFLLGTLFFASSIFSQIISAISAFASVRDDEWEDVTLTNCKGSLLLLTEAIVCGVCLLFAVTLPLAGKSHETIPFFTCITSGIPYILITAVVCFVVCLIINLVRFGQMKSSKNNLRLWCTGALSLILICVLVGHTFLNSFLVQNRHLYADCDVFKTLKSFKIYMEKEIAPDGSDMRNHGDSPYGRRYIVEGIDGKTQQEYILKESDIVKQLIEMDAPASDSWENRYKAEYGYEFEHLNRSVVHYELTDTEEIVPIYTFTTVQLEAADQIALGWNFQYMLLYIIPTGITAIIYLILRRKFA